MAEASKSDTVSRCLENDGIRVSLTYAALDISSVIASVRSPKAGATVLFVGTTRDSMNDQPVRQLQYSAYTAKALRTMLSIAEDVKTKHALTAVAMTHRLGVCPIGEESIMIAVSAPHRQAAWKGGQEALEECKAKAEVWKLEEFHGEEDGIWRANRDGILGEPMEAGTASDSAERQRALNSRS